MPSWNEALMIGMGDALTKMAASKKQGTIRVPGATLPGPGENLGKLMAQIKANTKATEVKLPAGAEIKKAAGFEFLKEAMTLLKGTAASRKGRVVKESDPEGGRGIHATGGGGREVSLSFLRERASRSLKRRPKGIEEAQEKARAKEREEAGEKESKLPMWLSGKEKRAEAFADEIAKIAKKECPGGKIRSKGLGRGMGFGEGKGPFGIPFGKKMERKSTKKVAG